MLKQDIKNKVIEELSKIGIIVDADVDDINISEYIMDSLQFMAFIVQIEKTFNICLPDEYMMVESLYSLNAFCENILYLLNIE